MQQQVESEESDEPFHKTTGDNSSSVCLCLLDLNCASVLLSCKIADIPQKVKYKTIIKPLFEYCFGITDDEDMSIWGDHGLSTSLNNEFPAIQLTIDWIRDQTFIYEQLFHLSFINLDRVACKFGLWQNRSFILKAIRFYNSQINEILSKDLRNDKEIVMAAIKENAETLKLASDELKNDLEIVELALGENYERIITGMIPKHLINREIVLKAVRNNALELEYVPEEFRNDLEIVKTSMHDRPYLFRIASDDLKRNRELVKLYAKHPFYQFELVKPFINDEEIAMITARNYRDALFHIPPELSNYFEIVKIAIQNNPYSFQYVSEKNNKEIVLLALTHSDNEEDIEKIFNCLSTELKNDRDVMLKAFEKTSKLKYLENKEFSNDREFIYRISKNDGLTAWKYASDELKQDRELVRKCVKQKPVVLRFVNEKFRKDREIVKLAVKKNGQALAYASYEFKDDEEIVELALKSHSNAFDYVSNRLRDDLQFMSNFGFVEIPEQFKNNREIGLKSIKLGAHSYCSLSTELQNDREFALKAVTISGIVLKHFKQEFKQDREIVLAAVTQRGDSIEFAAKNFMDDKEIVMKVIETLDNQTQKNGEVSFYEFISQRLQQDREICLAIVKKPNCWRVLREIPRKFLTDREIVIQAIENIIKSIQGTNNRWNSENEIVINRISRSLLFNDRLIALKMVKLNGKVLRKLCFEQRNDREIVWHAVKQNKEALKYASNELRSDKGAVWQVTI